MSSSSSSFSIPLKFFRIINIAIIVLFFSLTCLSNHVHSLEKETVFDALLLTEKINNSRTIIVDINGDGEFKSVQAINAAPQGNPNWIIIHVRKGIYTEKVYIPEDKPYIFMRENGKGKAAIVWSKSSIDNRESTTFSVEAPHSLPLVSASSEASLSIEVNVGRDQTFAWDLRRVKESRGDPLHYLNECMVEG